METVKFGYSLNPNNIFTPPRSNGEYLNTLLCQFWFILKNKNTTSNESYINHRFQRTILDDLSLLLRLIAILFFPYNPASAQHLPRAAAVLAIKLKAAADDLRVQLT